MTRGFLSVFCLSVLTACSAGSAKEERGMDRPPALPGPDYGDGSSLTLSEPQALSEQRAALEGELAALQGLTTEGLLESYPTNFAPAPSYDLAQVQGLDLIQASSIGLSQPELDVLATQGFVISGSKWFPSFGYGYTSIYGEDLPVYVSVDSI